MADAQKCAHPSCACTVAKGAPYGKVLQRALQGEARHHRVALRLPARTMPRGLTGGGADAARIMLAEPYMARKRWQWVVGVISLAVLVAGAIIVGYRIPISSDRLRREMIKTLSERLESQVELASLELHPFPRLRAVGTGLVIRHKRHPEVALISIQKFTVNADLGGLLRKHVAHVTLEGLAIQIPPGDKKTPNDSRRRTSTDGRERRAQAEAGPGRANSSGTGQKSPGMVKQLVIDEVVANESTSDAHPSRGGKAAAGCGRCTSCSCSRSD